MKLLIKFLVTIPCFVASVLAESSSAPTPKFTERCVGGFGGWLADPNPRDEEYFCDLENLRKFTPLLGYCNDSSKRMRNEASIFDIDNDGCLTCRDYELWKERLILIFRKKQRSSPGGPFKIHVCDVLFK